MAPDTYQVFVGEKELELNRKEYDILLYFMNRPERLVNKSTLAESVWGTTSTRWTTMTSSMHKSEPAQKLKAAGATAEIKAVYGFGYKFTRSMKLISHVTLRLSVAVTLILSVWAVLFYVAMIDEINDEVDDSLEDYSETIIIRALSGEQLPSKDNGSNNQYYLVRVDGHYAMTHPSIEYADEMVYIEEKRETEPARILRTIFENEAGEYFQLVVMTPTIEKRDVIHSILIWTSLLYATLLVIIIVLNIYVFYRSMQPLYRLLDWFRHYRVGQKNEPLPNRNTITEFRTLYDAANLYAARNEQLFEQQKRFIGNASHELQTPLAICRNRLEMLMEDEDITETAGGAGKDTPDPGAHHEAQQVAPVAVENRERAVC